MNHMVLSCLESQGTACMTIHKSVSVKYYGAIFLSRMVLSCLESQGTASMTMHKLSLSQILLCHFLVLHGAESP